MRKLIEQLRKINKGELDETKIDFSKIPIKQSLKLILQNIDKQKLDLGKYSYTTGEYEKSYKILFELSTHEANSVTEKDYSLAKSIDIIFQDKTASSQ